MDTDAAIVGITGVVHPGVRTVTMTMMTTVATVTVTMTKMTKTKTMTTKMVAPDTMMTMTEWRSTEYNEVHEQKDKQQTCLVQTAATEPPPVY